MASTSTIPALKGSFGTFEYWVTAMPVADLVSKVTIASKLDGWEDKSLEERYQRDLDLNRIRKEIAPYFAKEQDRFSSAIVLTVINHEDMEFEPLESVSKLSRPYRLAANNIGFLHFSGQEIFVPLDGQHRTQAFKWALSGKDDNGKDLGLGANTDLGKDEVTVLLIKYDLDKARLIFNKVNKYARAISKNGKIIVDDDDAVAVVTRAFVDGSDLIPPGLVNIKSNTLTAKMREFTTLPTLYEANKDIARFYCAGQGKPEDATEDQREVMAEEIVRVWDIILKEISVFRDALADTAEGGDDVRRDIRENLLLGKPVGQWSLLKGFLEAVRRVEGVTERQVCEALNKIDWRISNEMWVGVLTHQSGRVLAGSTVARRAGLFIGYLVGVELDEEEERSLAEQIYGDEDASLPERVV